MSTQHTARKAREGKSKKAKVKVAGEGHLSLCRSSPLFLITFTFYLPLARPAINYPAGLHDVFALVDAHFGPACADLQHLHFGVVGDLYDAA
jgi:hypothetical protein